MKIVIDLFNTGLGNNGGSRTLILCAETLSDLEHEVILFSNIKSKYTWHKIKSNVKLMYGKDMPNCDVAISTSPKSVDHTLSSSAIRKFYYIRGYEIFWCPKEMVHSGYRKMRCIVNSEWLQKFLKDMGIDSNIVYPGLDFDVFFNYKKSRKDIMGALFHKTLSTKNHLDAEKVAKKLGKKIVMLNKDISSPSSEKLRDFYNGIKVWMAPSELEGLHNPPMEASLCGCGLVATNHERSGMSDYVIHSETAMVYPSGNLEMAGQFIKLLMNDDNLRDKLNKNMVELLREKIGNRKDNMNKMIEIIRQHDRD
jgi:hypothetical protein